MMNGTVLFSKDNKEKWVAKYFLPQYNKIKNSGYSIKEKRERPDFIIENGRRERLGLEITEYPGFPRTKAGEQKVKEDQFTDIMERNLSDYKNYGFAFSIPFFPSKKEKLEELADKLTAEIKDCMGVQKHGNNFKFENLEVSFRFWNYLNDPLIFYGLSEKPFLDKDIEEIRNNFARGLFNLMWKKVKDAEKYTNKEENILVIYNNDNNSLPIKKEDIGKIIAINRQNLKEKKSTKVYNEIWLLEQQEIYQIY